MLQSSNFHYWYLYNRTGLRNSLFHALFEKKIQIKKLLAYVSCASSFTRKKIKILRNALTAETTNRISSEVFPILGYLTALWKRLKRK